MILCASVSHMLGTRSSQRQAREEDRLVGQIARQRRDTFAEFLAQTLLT
jgi:hypothetical protein